MTSVSIRGIIEALETAGPDAGQLVLEAIEAWKRGWYGKAYQGPPGPSPTPKELPHLTMGLIRWGDRHARIDLAPLQRFHEASLLCNRRAARDPAFDRKAALTKLEECLGEADGTLNRLKDLLTVDVASIRQQSAPTPRPQRNVVLSLGARQYRIGKCRPLAVTPTEDAVLQAFLDSPAMNDPTLKAKTKQDEPGKVLRRLRTKYDGIFAPAIDTPGGNGKGGYHVRITSKPAVSSSH
jgi:hypothetical protein